LGKSESSLQVMAWLNAAVRRVRFCACQNACVFSADGRRK
jgi:hypothetical protein